MPNLSTTPPVSLEYLTMQFWKTVTEYNEPCKSVGNKGFGPDFGYLQIIVCYLLCIKEYKGRVYSEFVMTACL